MIATFNLKDKRIEKNLSQQELSEISGVRQSLISMIENGIVKNPRIDTLLKLSSALGMDYSEVLFEPVEND